MNTWVAGIGETLAVALVWFTSYRLSRRLTAARVDLSRATAFGSPPRPGTEPDPGPDGNLGLVSA